MPIAAHMLLCTVHWKRKQTIENKNHTKRICNLEGKKVATATKKKVADGSAWISTTCLAAGILNDTNTQLLSEAFNSTSFLMMVPGWPEVMWQFKTEENDLMWSELQKRVWNSQQYEWWLTWSLWETFFQAFLLCKIQYSIFYYKTILYKVQ